MKYNKVISLASVMVLGLSMGSSIVSAGENGDNYTSNGKVEFTPSTDPVDPVDPTDPEIPVDPTDPTDPENPNPQPGTDGPLSIDFASSFYFGDQKISTKDEEYNAVAQEYKDKDSDGPMRKGPNYVQVTDRRGTLKGWTLTVNQAGQFKAGDDELDGAEVVLTDGNLKTISTSKKPTVVSEDVVLIPGTDLEIMSAKEGEGAGTFLARWGQDDLESASSSVKLKVPGSAMKKKAAYTTKFNWKLTNVPGK